MPFLLDPPPPSPKLTSVFNVYSQLGHKLKLKEDGDDVAEDATCIACKKSARGSPIYICVIDHDDYDCQDFYLHKSCAELPSLYHYHSHPLILKEQEEDIDSAACYICNTPILPGSLAYTCIHDDDTDCQSFYLHKSCGELQTQINHHKHNKHPLTLLQRTDSFCDICQRDVKFAYACDACDFDVCVFCALEQRVLHHQGHQEHTLTLMQREALFLCDACHEKAEDSSYVCTTCDFWIHKTCAFSPSIIATSTYHHHPLNLIYSIPDEHRYFYRDCNICKQSVYPSFWLYYCHKCTYFAHMKCATSSVIVNETEEDAIDNEPDLVQFPLPNRESLFDLILTQFAKFQVEGKNNTTILAITDDPHIIEEHWSHPDHPLQHLHFTIKENDSDDDIVDPIELICDGCIQPITISHPSYYACIQCDFFLHSFCATKLPKELPVGASPFHPEHWLHLWKRNTVFSLVKCGACGCKTNGFFYYCKTCEVKVDIRCAFLPTRIKHTSHKHHSLVQRPFSNSMCSISGYQIADDMEYGCEICTDFRIDPLCLFTPCLMKHKYDIHPISLRFPPFFYEGVFYCEICEEQVNNQELLYHCDKSDHSFHYECFNLLVNVKLGGCIKLDFGNRTHKCTFVSKRSQRKNFTYKCSRCKTSFPSMYFLECDGCGYLVCYGCIMKIIGECLPDEYVLPA